MEKEIQNSIGIKFVLIPEGEFIMGVSPGDKDANENEKPRHKVQITKSFYLGMTPVVQDQYENLMLSNPSVFKDVGKKAPVESVSWEDAQEFIQKLNEKEGTKGYRLPTEAEWEYSARAGATTKFYWGDSEEDIDQYAWTSINEILESTMPVMKKKPNAFGLYDMIGNVEEWCGDWYDEEYYTYYDSKDPKGPNKKGECKVLRGGSWYSSYVQRCRISYRYYINPKYAYYTRGFRLLFVP